MTSHAIQELPVEVKTYESQQQKTTLYPKTHYNKQATKGKQYFHITSWQLYWCKQKTKWWPCYLKPVLLDSNSFVWITLHDCKPCEWKCSIASVKSFDLSLHSLKTATNKFILKLHLFKFLFKKYFVLQ